MLPPQSYVSRASAPRAGEGLTPAPSAQPAAIAPSPSDGGLHFELRPEASGYVPGLLHFLGTNYGSELWRNPAGACRVTVLSNGLSYGSLDFLVAMPSADVNHYVRTINSADSYLGVDLGQGKGLRLEGYGLRARMATSHYLMSWDVEASADGLAWQVLDSQRYCKKLKLPGAVLNVPVSSASSSSGSSKVGSYFRLFRVVQRDVNSSGGHNLILSGLELYGRAQGYKAVG